MGHEDRPVRAVGEQLPRPVLVNSFQFGDGSDDDRLSVSP
jgi:hypothetical protein